MRVIILSVFTLSTIFAADTVLINDKYLWQDNNSTKGLILDWESANSYCNELHQAGFDDWRLPSVKELQEIVDTNGTSPIIQSSFQNSAADFYWTYVNSVSDSSKVWAVNFYHGGTFALDKDRASYVRCIRVLY